MSEKRIIIVTSELVPFYYGGIGTQFKCLAGLLERHGHKVSLLVRRPDRFNTDLYRAHYGEIPVYFVDGPPVAVWPPQHYAYAAAVARRFAELHAEVRPDLVICADFNAEGLFLLLRSAGGAYGGTRFLLTINGMNAEVISVREGSGRGESASIKTHPDIRLLLAMEDLCVHLAPTIVSPTSRAWGEVRQRLSIRNTAWIIPNLVDPLWFLPDGSGVQEPQGEPTILFVGRLDRMKGPDLLLKAYFEVAERMAPAIPRIIFIGRDCYWNEYGSTFLEYWRNRIPEKYADTVSFLGQVDHDAIRGYLKRASVAVFPSRWEPFGIVCLEALSMGCPVVVSSGTGLEEVLGPQFSDFAVPVTEDVCPLAGKILSLLGVEKGEPDGSGLPMERPLPERLRARALEVVRQAETGWLELLQNMDGQEKSGECGANPLCDPVHRLLVSLEDAAWRGETHLQVYFRRRGGYTEADSLRVSYSPSRWAALTVPLPKGTGESPLRIDPSDTPSTIRIREIVLFGETGDEILRADGSNRFEGCHIGGNDACSIRNDVLLIEAKTDDPQVLFDCPVTDRPVILCLTLCASANP
jgi:glycosyltransferase involved in cell wall biosynthesis